MEKRVGDLNDKATRKLVTEQMTNVFDGMMSSGDIVDYTVCCNESNNTPDRIDNNELYIDTAVKPDEETGFIFIPGVIKPN